MILAVDIGNSLVKWKCYPGENERQSGFVPNTIEGYKELAGKFEGNLKSLYISNVRKEEVSQTLSSFFTGVDIVDVVTPKSDLGITVVYKKPESLGVDRWLAMVEAKALSVHSPVMIFDFGTAATMDLVDGEGSHLGGYIVPGLHGLKNSLLHGTDRVRFKDVTVKTIEYGEDTEHAVWNGIFSLLVSWVVMEISRAKVSYPDLVVYITGGDANKLAGFLGEDVILHEDLVLDGLIRLARS